MTNKPILANIPSAYKSSILYSVLPTNSDGDFTFSRASSATRVNKDGLIETVSSNIPRLDYSDGGCPSLLLEPQRTNTYLTSEPTANEGGAGNITYESHFWENGLQNAVRFEPSVTGYRYGGTATASTEMTISCYVKMNDGGEPFMGGNASVYDFGLVIASSVVSGAKKEYIGNDIWRVYGTFTPTANSSNNGVVKYSGQSNRGFICTGFQLEAGSYPTSYIPTTGIAETRLADNCYGAGDSNLFNDSEGVLYAEIQVDVDGGFISLNGATSSNRVTLYFHKTDKRILAISSSSGVAQAYMNYYFPTNMPNKIKVAFKYKENDFALWVNGVELLTDNIGLSSIGLQTLDFSFNGGNNFYGKCKDIRIYNEILTDTKLATLTSL